MTDYVIKVGWTTCPAGHRYDRQLLHANGYLYRACQTCRNIAQQRYMARKRGGTNPKICSTPTVLRLRALCWAGYCPPDIAQRIGVSSKCLYDLTGPAHTRPPLVFTRTAEKVDAIYQELRYLEGPSPRTKKHAENKSWWSPMKLDDEEACGRQHLGDPERYRYVTEYAPQVEVVED